MNKSILITNDSKVLVHGRGKRRGRGWVGVLRFDQSETSRRTSRLTLITSEWCEGGRGLWNG